MGCGVDRTVVMCTACLYELQTDGRGQLEARVAIVSMERVWPGDPGHQVRIR